MLFFVRFFVPLVFVVAEESSLSSSFARRLRPAKISVVGSLNADTFFQVERLPVEGENLLCYGRPIMDQPGGKGCTQAVAAAKLSKTAGVCFGGRFGNDAVGDSLRQVLVDVGVDVSAARTASSGCPTGRGYVFGTRNGQVSAVVVGGSNQEGWGKVWEAAWTTFQTNPKSVLDKVDAEIDYLLDDDTGCLLLQREVPEHVNTLLAAKARRKKIIVLQDVGGDDRPMSPAHMANCDYLIPNESELIRLVNSFEGDNSDEFSSANPSDLQTNDVVRLAQLLQGHGAQNVLVTQGAQGCTLVTVDGDVICQPAFLVPQGNVVDETGAGDCFRAAFAVALMEGYSLGSCLELASAAGCLAVQMQGAVPSVPTREAVNALLSSQNTVPPSARAVRGGESANGGKMGAAPPADDFPFLIGSRLNSMKDRPELWEGLLTTPRDFVRRQATIKGLTCIDFNYPQHFSSYWTVAEAKAALDEEGLVAGAVCLRYPKEFARGAMNHPDPDMRRRAIELTKEAAQVALDLECKEVVVWSAYDGYDYMFQVDYDAKWRELVEAFQECCDAFPTVKFSVEYKPTDENTRFFTIPSTGAALCMVHQVDRRNFGLTLDVGHMLMSGENPGQSIAMAGKKLFGIQLNDGFTRLAAEDGLMFGSVHPGIALEIMYQLRRIEFEGHIYFDTFPQRSDPVKEAEYNIRRVKAFHKAAGRLLLDHHERLQNIQATHDAVGALSLIDEALQSM